MNNTTLLRASICASIFGLGTATAGCASGATEPVTASAEAPTVATAGDEQVPTADLFADAAALDALDEATAEPAASSLATLPPAPWSAAPVDADGENAALVAAWSQADNSSFCAPLSLSSDAIGDANARVSSLAGGWLIEFDQSGAPGVRANGSTCSRCGRGAFGIAGTGMSPDEVFDLDEEQDVTPTFSDGSAVQLAEVEEGVASATVTVQGQGCVYQVWSFLGQDHLDALLAHMRFVRVDRPTDTAVASLGD